MMKKISIVLLFLLSWTITSCVKQVGDFRDGVAIAKRMSKYGYIDQEKKIVIDCIYEDAKDFRNKVAFVKQLGKWGAITIDGETIISIEYDTIYDNQYGIIAMTNGKQKLLSDGGNMIIPTTFDKIEYTNIMGENLLIKENGQCQLYSPSGNLILPFKFENISESSEGVRCIKLNYGNFKLLYDSGEMKDVGADPYEICGDMSINNIVRIKRNNKYGFIDMNSVEIIPCIFDDTEDYFCGFAKVKLNGKWGVISNTLFESVPCMYDDVVIAHNTSDTYRDVAVKRKGKWALCTMSSNEDCSLKPMNTINDRRNEISNEDFIYSEVLPYKETFIVRDNNGYGIVRRKVDYDYYPYYVIDYLNPLFSKIKMLDNNSYAYRINGLWGTEYLSDETAAYEDIKDNWGGFSIKSNGKWGVYNISNDKIQIPCIYDEVGSFGPITYNTNIIPVRKGEKWFYLNEKGERYNDESYKFAGKLKRAEKYSLTNEYSEYKYVGRYQTFDGLWHYFNVPGTYIEACDFGFADIARVKGLDGSTYFIDYDGEQVFPSLSIVITDIYPFHGGFALVKYSDGLYGYIDKEGKPQFDRYEFAQDFENGRAWVSDNISICKWEIDTKGKQVRGSTLYTEEGAKMMEAFGKSLELRSTNSQIIEHAIKTHQQVMQHVKRQTQGMP